MYFDTTTTFPQTEHQRTVRQLIIFEIAGLPFVKGSETGN